MEIKKNIMSTENAIKIINIEEVNPRVLQFQFNAEWTMDNTTVIIDHLLQQTSATVLESIQGADVYCVRIRYGVSEFLLVGVCNSTRHFRFKRN